MDPLEFAEFDALTEFEATELLVSTSEALMLASVQPDDFECDVCRAVTLHTERHEVRVPRPSAPSEMVAIFWTCMACAESTGAKPYGEWVALAEASQDSDKPFLLG